ncbi:MAG: flagellar assembly protein FliW [Gallionella sp.]|jgi:flagellar assembly factor FliW|nr:flagellar assembly protein FliW [Gallionella sp.]MCK9354941.1 flagellar assembly protein FliW [Gallionella sp.]
MASIKVDTRFGELEVDPSQIITFPRGIPGFEKSTQWKLFHEIDEQGSWAGGVVVYLQSIDDADVLLPLTDPTLFGFNYDLALSDSEAAELKLEEPGDVLVLTTLSAKHPDASGAGRPSIAGMYVNISAPILINIKSHIGMQKMLSGSESSVGFSPKPEV